uniref:Thyroid stimulating hormone receptor n=1 Tax=Callorhinchus milii TaxID=7868 RepID=A0A4W3J826_CALMI
MDWRFWRSPLGIISLCLATAGPGSRGAKRDVCPSECECSEWTALKVTCKEIDRIPALSSSTETLRFMETHLKTIPTGAFANLPNISRIYISIDATLQRVDALAFFSLNKVTHM